MDNKRCSKCNSIKDIEHFHISRTIKSGYQSWCKECNKERSRKKDYKYKKCEQCSSTFKIYGNNTHTKCRYCKRKNSTKGKKPNNWTGSEHFAGRKISEWISSAKRRGHSWELSKDDLDLIFNSQNGICKLSGLIMEFDYKSPFRPSLDRIDSNIGYTIDNCQFICSMINVMKNKYNEKDFIKMCGVIFLYNS